MSLPPFNESFAPRYTESPNPSWQYGDKVGGITAAQQWLEGEKQGWTSLDTSVETSKLYPMMISGIVPRPVAFVSSISETGVENLAPFSFFNMVAFDPPAIIISCSNKPRIKDTCHNIRTTKGFTVNIISEPFVENANVTAVDCPEGVSEWDVSGLTRVSSVLVKPARVKESAFSMECELLDAHNITNPSTGIASNTLIIGWVKHIHVRNDVLNERGVVDPTKLRPVVRVGDISYARLGDVFRLTRHVWEKEKEKMQGSAQKDLAESAHL
ncbi:hypothetical protein DACRYDRAFT_112365 [Dacryopinax primogenitus]|uniref:Flavin reductase like domain-containing protein n=1 Tax=Dacryopinax primogenitus (strain DJM 731) TaxID=1858805 RepID=M5FQL0_DACPD|nr:uncharacterized protein DACRYDRAFT_112365 [Dacryopinax primogenitus]EJT97039.1 hypothetical protein DACRYDRAFT_112365 [Dacryopinax primogenitus]